jgi:hypothetical protein
MTQNYTVTDDGKLVEDEDDEQSFSEMNFDDGGET